MANLFDDDDRDYVVVVNAERQHSLWPTGVAVPDGWSVVFGADSRDACLEFVQENWKDIRPLSLAREMDTGR